VAKEVGVKVQVDPHFDTDNSDPPAVEFEDGHHTIMIRMHLPEREIQFEKQDLHRILQLFALEDDS
jgi:hypothetical protein